MAIDGRAPNVAVARANDLILADARSGLFVTLFYVILEPDRGEITYVNGGHMPPILLRAAGGEIEELRTDGMALGVLEGTDWAQETLQMAPGDAVVLYTDGIPDARDAGGAMFGEDRLLEVAQKAQGCTAREVQEALLDEVHGFVGKAPRFDDITLMVLAMECAPEPVELE